VFGERARKPASQLDKEASWRVVIDNTHTNTHPYTHSIARRSLQEPAQPIYRHITTRNSFESSRKFQAAGGEQADESKDEDEEADEDRDDDEDDDECERRIKSTRPSSGGRGEDKQVRELSEIHEEFPSLS
jgi:hypothetical protein